MRIFTYFLPQFYPTPENSKYWGDGFTEWVNVKAAKPLFEGHRQPIEPAKFGYYNLRKPEVLQEIAEYSQNMGIDGFCYWHYWFGNGFKTLEKVQEMHIANKSIKQNFFFAWANHDWTKSWVGENTIIFKQEYSKKSAIEHFEYLKQFIDDPRYIKIKNKPALQVYNPDSDGCHEHVRILEEEAIKYLGNGFYWLFPERKKVKKYSDLSYSKIGLPPANIKNLYFTISDWLQHNGLRNKCLVLTEKMYLKVLRKDIRKYSKNEPYIPCILSGWDNTPRYGNKGFLFNTDIPSFIKNQFSVIKEEIDTDKLEILFIKSWNEWAEGNILEPYSYNNTKFEPFNAIRELRQ